MRWSSQPNYGTVNKNPVIQTTKVQGVKVDATPLQGFGFFTYIPGGMSLRSSPEKPSDTRPAQYLLANSDRFKADQIAITVARFDGIIGEIPAVALRQGLPSTYESLPSDFILPQGAIGFRKKDLTEITVFWPHDLSYGAISASGSNGQYELLHSHISSLLSSWSWQ